MHACGPESVPKKPARSRLAARPSERFRGIPGSSLSSWGMSLATSTTTHRFWRLSSSLADLNQAGAFHLFFADTLMLALYYVRDPQLRTRLVRGFVLGTLVCPDSSSCGRLSARSTASMELAWELRLMFEGDLEITAALDGIIEDGQKFVGVMDRTKTRQLEVASADRAAMANFYTWSCVKRDLAKIPLQHESSTLLKVHAAF